MDFGLDWVGSKCHSFLNYSNESDVIPAYSELASESHRTNTMTFIIFFGRHC
jgi:hypothetical protein